MYTCTVPNTAYGINNADILLWGTMEIHSNEAAARASVPEFDTGLRLVRVADHDELKALLVPGRETVRDGAALYMRIAETCPGYYVQCDEADEKYVYHEMRSSVHLTLKQKKPDLVFRDSEGLLSTPLKLSVLSAIGSAPSGTVIRCRSSPLIIRGPDRRQPNDSSSSSEEHDD